MPFDKQKHLLAGLALSFLVGFLLCPLFGLISAAIVGALKEIVWDKWLRKGTPEWWDFWATVAGGLVGYILISFARLVVV